MEQDEYYEKQQRESRKKNPIWMIITGFFALGSWAAVYIPALAGEPIVRPGQTGPAVMVWTGLLLAAIWRYREKSGWLGFILGLALGFVIFGIAGFTSGFVGAMHNQ